MVNARVPVVPEHFALAPHSLIHGPGWMELLSVCCGATSQQSRDTAKGASAPLLVLAQPSWTTWLFPF